MAFLGGDWEGGSKFDPSYDDEDDDDPSLARLIAKGFLDSNRRINN